jgi:hypothetical protein
MIRTILLSSAILIASVSAANAVEVRVALTGKTEAAIKAEIAEAAKTACRDVSVLDYAPCVQETYQQAMASVAKAKATKLASLTF